MARKTLIQVRRDTAANWTSANPTLSAGEFGFETDTGKVKIGDGSTAWTSLGYLVTDAKLVLADVTTNDVSTSKHGFAPKAPNDVTKFLDGTGAYSRPTGASPGSGGSARLYDYEVTGSDKASIDTNVDGSTVANFSGYDVLEIWMILRTDDAAAAVNVDLIFNNDTGANYDNGVLNASNTTVSASTALAQTSLTLTAHGSGGTSGYAAVNRLSIPGYAGTVFNKTGELTYEVPDGTAGNNRLGARIIGWRSTSAITRLKVAALGAAKLKVGSRLLVYGK